MNEGLLDKMDYKTLLDKLIDIDDSVKYNLLSKNNIKRKLLGTDNMNDFLSLLEVNDSYFLYTLLQDGGCDILKKSSNSKEKITSILTSEVDNDKLFKINDFDKLILDDLYYYNFSFFKISINSAKDLYDYFENNSVDEERKILLINSFSNNVEYELIKEKKLSFSMIEKLLFNSNPLIIEEILKYDERITTLSNYSFKELFDLFNSNVNIPSLLLNENKFVDKIVNIDNVKDYRFLINMLMLKNDVFKIENKRKKYYEKQFDDFDKELGMLKKYKEVYLYIKDNFDKLDIYSIDGIINKFNFFDYGNDKKYIRNELFSLIGNKDIKGIKSLFQEESNLKISDMIVDYHYKDIYYNFLLDLRSLVDFQKKEGRTLTDEDIEVYNKLLNLDNLNFDEKMKLHNKLMGDNLVNKFYDDFRSAKDKSFELIKDKVLTKENITKYKDNKLSSKYGVDVYVLDKDPFYIFVKSLKINKKTLLKEEDIEAQSDIASYSLDSSGKLNTFKDPVEFYNLAYDFFPYDQIMHVYPVDSFSNFRENGMNKATNRVYYLGTPEDIVDKSKEYDEFVLAQNYERYNYLKNPIAMGIYCYNVISDNDIKSAKETGLSLILVKTKNYKKVINDEQITFRDTLNVSNKYQKGIDYIKEISEDDMFGRRKR